MRPPFTRALRRPHVQRRRNARLEPGTQEQTFPNRRLQTEVSSLMARRLPGAMLHIFRRGGYQPPAGRTLCAPTSPFLSRARAPAGRSEGYGVCDDVVTLRLARGRVAFAATRAGLRAASRPCARPCSAPSSPARGLRASRCHAAARARPGRFRCDSGWSPGRLAALRSPSLRSKLPCARPPRFSLTGAFPAPPSAPRIPACPAAHTYCSYRPPHRAG